VDYDSEYRRQYCRERMEQMRDEYRRVQRPPKEQRERSVWMRSVWERMRRQVPERVPVYRS
jgi:hypothetical protein